MSTKRWLIVVPLVVVAVLLQAAFWVPRYETQSAGNPKRLTTYIEAGIGDPQLLNPILSADNAASEVEGLVFDTLLDIDEELRPRGKLAERWELSEEATLLVLPGRRLPDGTPASASAVAARIRAALQAGPLSAELRGVEALAPEERSSELSSVSLDEAGQPHEQRIPVRIELPERVRIVLGRVVPDLLERLTPALGAGLLDERGLAARVHPEAKIAPETLAVHLPELLPLFEHNPIVTFHLRRDARFHDGHPFDAGDVLFTYQAIVDPKNASPRVSSFEPVKAVEIVDDYTVRVVYKRLYSPAIVEWIYMGILPEHLMNAAALAREMDRRGITGSARAEFSLRQSETGSAPVGTGPFRFVRWQRDELVELARNEDYWKGPAEFERVFLRTIPDAVTQELEFRAGAVDSYTAMPHQVARYRKDPRYRPISTVTNTYSYIAYNLRRPVFQDVRVRRALAMAVDVDSLIANVLYGEAQRVSGPYYASSVFYNPETKLVPFDPEGAARLLAEAGWKPGPDGILAKDGQRLAFKLITNNGNPQRRAIMTIAQDAWKKLGIDVVTQALEWTVFLEEFVNQGDFDALVLGWSGGALDPDLFQIWHSSQTGKYQLNFSGYASPEADRLIERIRVEYDPAIRLALAHQLHERIASDQPFTFLFAPRGTYVLDRKMVIVEHDAEGRERYRPIEPVKGILTFYFERWRKLAGDPVFEAGGLSMGSFLLRAIAQRIALLFVVSVLAFAVVHLAPGEPSQVDPMNPRMKPQDVARIRAAFHLDEPLPVQYGYWLRDLASGDLRSFQNGEPVLARIWERFLNSVPLFGVEILVIWTIAFPVGIRAALTRGSPYDRASTFVSYFLISVPGYVVAYLAILWVVNRFQLPVIGMRTFGLDEASGLRLVMDRLWHLAIPSLIAALGGIAVLSRYVRAQMLEVVAQDYVRTARAKGLPEERVVYHHALRNALLPFVTLFGFLIPGLIGGSVIVEQLFAWPGLGRLGYDAILARDFPLILTINFFAAALTLAGTFLSDVLYAVVDPRIRLG